MTDVPRPLVRALLGVPSHTTRPERVRRRVGGRLAVVTGASRGIGAACARRLAACDARVVLVARPSRELTATRDALHRAGATATAIPCDLRDTDAARDVALTVLADHGAPEVVVSNAGHSIHRTLAASIDRFHDVSRTAGVNYLGAVALLLPLLAAMRTRGRGSVVSVSSASLGLPLPGWAPYGASKAAFEEWFGAVAPELAADGIRCSSLYLPRVATRMSAPTRGRYPVPELTADEAAALVCRAIVTGTRVIRPWWSRGAAGLHLAFPGATHRVLTGATRRGVAW